MPSIITGQQIGLFNSSLAAVGALGNNPTIGQNKQQVHVNAATGNVVLQSQDILQIGLGKDVNLVRTYNSQGKIEGKDKHFIYSWEKQIKGRSSHKSVTLYHGDGSRSEFVFSHSDEQGRHFISTDGEGAHDTLLARDNVWTLFEGETQTQYIFDEQYDSKYQLTRVIDKEGLVTHLEYSKDKLISIRDEGGQRIQFTYDHNTGLVTRVESWQADTLQAATHYEYDQRLRLTRVLVDLDPSRATLDDNEDGLVDDQNDQVYITEYSYYEHNEIIGNYRVKNNDLLIKAINQSDANSLRFYYTYHDGDWQVKATVKGEGQDQQVTRFDYRERITDVTLVLDKAYEPANDSTAVSSEGRGYGLTTSYEYDDKDRLFRVISPVDENGQRLVNSYHYDDDGNIRSITDGRNQTTHYAYDSRGNVIEMRDAHGNSTKQAFDDNNLLIKRSTYLDVDTDGAGPSSVKEMESEWFVYDDLMRLRFSISSEGRVRESRYNDDNQQQQVVSDIVYTQHNYHLSAQAQGPELLELEQWVASLEDLSSTQRSDNYYDSRGQLSQVISFNAVEFRGEEKSASIQRYHYNEKGQLLTRQNSDELINWLDPEHQQAIQNGAKPSGVTFTTTRYSYDGLGRLLSTSDPDGHVQNYYYATGKHHDRGAIVTTQANDLQIVESYNTAGLLISTSENDVSPARYQALGKVQYFYDKAGRQIGSQGATGVIEQVFYDRAGRVIASLDGSGYLVEKKYNENNLLIEEIAYANAVSQDVLESLLDKNVDGEIVGLLRYNEHGEENSLLTGILPQLAPDRDRSSYFFYDAADRLSYFVDGAGAITKNIYDGESKLVKQVAFSDMTGVEAVRDLLNPNLEFEGKAEVVLTTGVGEPSAINSVQLVDGRYVSVWALNSEIYAQIFTALGQAEGPSVLVKENVGGTRAALTPVVTYLKDGGFVVFYEAEDPREDYPKLEWQQFSSTGEPVISVAQNDGFPYYAEGGLPSVTTLLDGSVVVAQQLYRSERTFNRVGWDIHAERLLWNKETGRLGRDSAKYTYKIAAQSDGDQIKASVSALEDGGFTIVWQDDARGSIVTGKRYYKDGVKEHYLLEEQFDISQSRDEQSEAHVVGLKGGAFIAVWQAPNAFGQSVIKARRYSADRQENLSEYTVAVEENLGQSFNPVVKQFDDGSLLLVWQSEVNGQSLIKAQHLSALGEAKNPAFIVSMGTDVAFDDLMATELYGNRAVINWSETNSQGQRVLKQRLLGIPRDSDIAPAWVSEDNRSTRSIYDKDGLMLGEIDPDNYLTRFKYDGGGQLIETIQYAQPVEIEGIIESSLSNSQLDQNLSSYKHADDRHTRNIWDSQGRLQAKIDPDGFLTHYHYDGNSLQIKKEEYLNAITPVDFYLPLNDLLAQVGSEVKTTEYRYTARGELREVQDPNGLLQRFIYDSEGRLLRQVASDQSDSFYNPLDTASERRVAYEYDKQGRLIKEIFGSGGSSKQENNFRYDLHGRLVSSTDTQGNNYWYFYDNNNRLTHELNEEGEVKITGYNAFGQVTKRITPNKKLYLSHHHGPDGLYQGGLLTPELEALFEGLFTDDSEVNVFEYAYDQRGLLSEQRDGENYLTRQYYNVFGDRIQTSQEQDKDTGLFSHTRYRFDKRGNAVQMVNEHDKSALRELEALSANPHLNDYSHTTQFFDYDAFGQNHRYTDGNGHVVDSQFDGRGNLIESSLNGRMVSQQYFDAFNRLKYKLDALNSKTTLFYDEFTTSSQRTRSAAGIETEMHFNAYQEIIQMIDGKGGEVFYAHDQFGNTSAQLIVDGSVVSFKYNAEGQLMSQSNSLDVMTHYSYDRAGRLTDEDLDSVDSQGTSLHRNKMSMVNEQGEVAFTVDSNGVETHYTYDRNSRVIRQVIDPNGIALFEEYQYDGLGNVTQVTYGSDNREYDDQNRIIHYEYDAKGRLINEYESVFHQSQGIHIHTNTEYRYDNNDQLLSRTQFNGAIERTQYYNYNDQGQVIRSMDHTGLTTAYYYDVRGNLLQTTKFSEPGYVDYDGQIRLSYTSNEHDRSTVYAYDLDNRLILSIDPEGYATRYAYDANNNLTEQTAYDEPQDYLFQDLRLFNEGNIAEVNDHILNQEDSAFYHQIVEQHHFYKSEKDRTEFSVYDARNRKVISVNGEGFIERVVYDSENNVVQTVQYAEDLRWFDVMNRYPDIASDTYSLEQFLRELDSRPQSFENNSGDLVEYFYYDGANRLTASIDSMGYLTVRDYHDIGISQTTTRYGTSLAQAMTAGVYNRVSADWSLVRGQRQTTEDHYDGAGRLVETIDVEKQSSTAFRYDSFSNVIAELTGLSSFYHGESIEFHQDGRKVSRDFDTQGRLLKEVQHDLDPYTGQEIQASTISYQYDWDGRLVQRDENGNQTLYFYDDKTGRRTHEALLVKVDDQSQQTVTNEQAGSWQAEVLEIKYNTFGEVVERATFGERIAANNLYGGSNYYIKNATDALKHKPERQTSTTMTEYNRRGEVVQLTDAEDNKSVMTYTAFGELESQLKMASPDKDNKLGRKTYHYDRRGLQVKSFVEVQANARGIVENQLISENNFDAFGRVIAQYDGLSNKFELRYDNLGGLIETEDDLGRVKALEYDAFERIVKEVDARGNETTYDYDDYNNSMVLSINGQHLATQTYNRHGALITLAESDGSTQTFYYDRRGNLLKSTESGADGLISEMVYGYDANSLVTEMRANGYRSVYQYDAAKRQIKEIVDTNEYAANSGEQFETRMTFDAKGNLIKKVDANGSVSLIRYDRNNRISWTVVDPDGAGDRQAIFTHVYYDKVGNQVREDKGYIDARTVELLVQSDGDGSVALNEIVSKAVVDTSQSYQYDGLNRLVSKTAVDGQSAQYTYDAANNIIRINQGGMITHQVFNDANELIVKIAPGGGVTRFVYDENGNTVIEQRFISPIEIADDADQATVLMALEKLEGQRFQATFSWFDDRNELIYRVDGERYLSEYRYLDNRRVQQHIRHSDQLSINWAWLAKSDLLSSDLLNHPEISNMLGLIKQQSEAATGQIEHRVYDERGLIEFEIDQAGYSTRHFYDEAGQVEKSIRLNAALDINAITDLASTRQQWEVINQSPSSQYAVARTYYDAQGRIRFQIKDYTDDGLPIIMENRYDRRPGEVGYAILDIRYESALTIAFDELDGLSTEQLARRLIDSQIEISQKREQRYDGLNQLTLQIDYVFHEDETQSARVKVNNYNAEGRLAETYVQRFTVNSEGINLNWPKGQKFNHKQMTYDDFGRLEYLFTSTAVDNNHEIFIQPSYATVIGESTNDIYGFFTQYRYDALGNISEEIVYFDEQVNIKSLHDAQEIDETARRRITRYDYNGNNELEEKSVAEGIRSSIDEKVLAKERYQYDALGNKTGVFQFVDPEQTFDDASANNNLIQSFTYYDMNNRIVEVVQAAKTNLEQNSVYHYDLDIAGWISRFLENTPYSQWQEGYSIQAISDAEGRFTFQVMDQRNLTIAKIDPSGGVVTSEYDAFGNVVRATDANGNVSRFFYDKQHQLRYTVGPRGEVNESLYNDNNQLETTIAYAKMDNQYLEIETIDELKAILVASSQDQRETREYDSLGQLKRTIKNDEVSESYEYNALGKVTKKIDARGVAKHFLYDALGREVGVYEYVSAEAFQADNQSSETSDYFTIKRYDVDGRLTAYGELGERATQANHYDVLGNELSIVNSLLLNVSDPVGNPDALNSEIIQSDSQQVLAKGLIREYDSRGNLISEKSPSGYEKLFFYNALNHQIAVIDAEGYITLSEHDLMGNVSLDRGYNYKPLASGILSVSELRLALLNISRVHQLEQFFQLSAISDYRESVYGYDANYNLASYRSDSAIESFSAELGRTAERSTRENRYDLNNNIIEQTDALGRTTYNYYDASNQLVMNVSPELIVTLREYDTFGQVVTERVLNKPLEGVFADKNAAETFITQYKLALLALSEEGSLVKDSAEAESFFQLFESEAAAQAFVARHVSLSSDKVTRKVYDAYNRQIAKVVENYHYDGSQPGDDIADRKNNAVQITHYSYGEDIKGELKEHGLELVRSVDVAAYQETEDENYSEGVTLVINGRERHYQKLSDSLTQFFSYDELGRKTLEVSNEFRGYSDLDKNQDGSNIARKTRFTYDYLNQVRSEVKLNSNNEEISGQYTHYEGALKRAEYGMVGHRAFQYDKEGNIETVYDFETMAKKTFSYDKNSQRQSELTQQIKVVKDGAIRLSGGAYQLHASQIVLGEQSLEHLVTTYNGFGEVLTRTNNGHEIERNHYDRLGRLIISNQGDGVKRLYAYDEMDNQTLEVKLKNSAHWPGINSLTQLAAKASRGEIKLDEMIVTINVFDKDDRHIETRVLDPKKLTDKQLNWSQVLDNVAEYTVVKAKQDYDSFGNVIKKVDGRGNATKFQYNALDQVIVETGPTFKNKQTVAYIKPETHYYYDGQGRKIATRNARGHITRQSWAIDKVDSIINADNSKFVYLYDALGNLRVEKKKRSAKGTVDFAQYHDYDYSGVTTQKNDNDFAYRFTSDVGQKRDGRIKVDTVNLKTGEQRATKILSSGGTVLRTTTEGAEAYILVAEGLFNYKLEEDTTVAKNAQGKRIAQHVNYLRQDALGRTVLYQDFEGVTRKVDYAYSSMDMSLGGYQQRETTTYQSVGAFAGGIEVRTDEVDYYGRMHREGLLSANNDGSRFYDYEYNGLGLKQKKTIDSGFLTTYQYDYLGRESAVTNYKKGLAAASIKPVGKIEKTYDLNDNLKQEVISYKMRYQNTTSKQLEVYDETRIQDYDYNSQNWLEKFTLTGQVYKKNQNDVFDTMGQQRESTIQKYDFDAMGNRISLSGNKDYQYDELNRLYKVGKTTITYDALGQRFNENTNGGSNIDYGYKDGQIEYVKVDNKKVFGQDIHNGKIMSNWTSEEGESDTAKMQYRDRFGRVIYQLTTTKQADSKDYSIQKVFSVFSPYHLSERTLSLTETREYVEAVDQQPERWDISRIETFDQWSTYGIYGDRWQKETSASKSALWRADPLPGGADAYNRKWDGGQASYAYTATGQLDKVTKHRTRIEGNTPVYSLQEELYYDYDINEKLVERSTVLHNVAKDSEDFDKHFTNAKQAYETAEGENKSAETDRTTAETALDGAMGYLLYLKEEYRKGNPEVTLAVIEHQENVVIPLLVENFNNYDKIYQKKNKIFQQREKEYHDLQAFKNSGTEARFRGLYGDLVNTPKKLFHYQGFQLGEIEKVITSKKVGEGASAMYVIDNNIVRNFDYSYRPVDRSGSSYYHSVEPGQSLTSIAKTLFGDESLWYLLADANGLTGDAKLYQGQQLLVPAVNGNQANNHATFKPFDLSDSLGNIDPYLPIPPEEGMSCKQLAAVIGAVLAAIVIAVGVSVLTFGAGSFAGIAGALGMALGVVAGTTGAAVFTAVMGTLAGIVIAAAAGAVSQGILIAGGVQEKFDTDEFIKNIIIGAVTGFLSGAIQGINQAKLLANIAKNASKLTGAIRAISNSSNVVAKGVTSTARAVAGSLNGLTTAAKSGAARVVSFANKGASLLKNFAAAHKNVAKVASVAAKGASSFAQGAFEGAAGQLAGELYDVGRGKEFNGEEILLAGFTSGVTDVFGDIGDSIADFGAQLGAISKTATLANRSLAKATKLASRALKGSNYALGAASSIGVSYAAEGIRSAINGTEFDPLNAALESIGEFGGFVTRRIQRPDRIARHDLSQMFARGGVEFGSAPVRRNSIANNASASSSSAYSNASDNALIRPRSGAISGRRSLFMGNRPVASTDDAPTFVIRLGEDAATIEAQSNLASKGNRRALDIDDLQLANGANSKLVVTGHGGVNSKGEPTVGGYTGDEALALFQSKGFNEANKISIAACGAGACSLNEVSFSNSLAAGIKTSFESQNPFSAKIITAPLNDVFTFGGGRRAQRDAAGNNLHHAPKQEIIFENGDYSSRLTQRKGHELTAAELAGRGALLGKETPLVKALKKYQADNSIEPKRNAPAVGRPAEAVGAPAKSKPTDPNGFTTLGVSEADAINFLKSDTGQEFFAGFRDSSPGVDAEVLVPFAISAIRSGKQLPVGQDWRTDIPLVKVVPEGNPVNAKSGYFTSTVQLYRGVFEGYAINKSFALPQSNNVPKFDVYQIQAKLNDTKVWKATIAPTQEGSILQPGGAKQFYVTNRDQFTVPEKINQLYNNGFGYPANRGDILLK